MQQRQVNHLAEQLLTYEVEALRRQADEIGGQHVVAQIFDDKNANVLKQMASTLVEAPGHVALLGAVAGDKLTLVFARSQDGTLHAGNLLKATLAEYGGGGGGRPELAQGGGIPADQAEAVLAFAVSQIELLCQT